MPIEHVLDQEGLRLGGVDVKPVAAGPEAAGAHSVIELAPQLSLHVPRAKSLIQRHNRGGGGGG